MSRVACPEDAEDLLQEILIKTHKNISTLKDPQKLKAWLFQIARNALTDYYRKVRPNHSDEAIPELGDLEKSEPGERIREELGRCIEPFLARLPDKYRGILEAVDLRGESQKALAESLGLSYSAVKSRAQRGRKMLHELFLECCSIELDARGRVKDYEAKSDCC